MTAPDGSVVCHAFAIANCAEDAACNPVWARQYDGDVENCTARWTLYCLANAGAGWTSGKIEQCTEQIKTSTSCFDGQFGVLEACELPPGTLPNGALCDVRTQCASLNCEFTFGMYPDGGPSLPVCGVCAPGAGPPSCGGAAACQSPQRCLHDRDENRDHCITPQPEGAPCVSEYGCEDGLFCQRPPSGSATWLCSRRGAAGAACTDQDGCDKKAGLRCVAGMCSLPTFVPVSAECDDVGRLCENGLCLHPLPIPLPPAPPGTPTCKTFLDDGSPCDTAVWYGCRFPALCRDSQCRLPGDAQCRAPQ